MRSSIVVYESIKHYICVFAFSIRVAILRQLEYPLFLFSWLLMNPIQWLSGIWILHIITSEFQPLNGWGFPQLTFLYGLGLLSHGIFFIFFTQTWEIEFFVQRGQFDRMMLRPISVLYQFCVSNFNFVGITDLVPGLIIFILGCVKVHFQWTISSVLTLILVLIGATLIRASLFLLVGSIAFWTKSSRSLVFLMDALLDRTTIYPFSVYPQAFQYLLTFVIPIGFISFIPSASFLGTGSTFSFPFYFALSTPIVGGFMFVLARVVFNHGMKVYESSGS